MEIASVLGRGQFRKAKVSCGRPFGQAVVSYEITDRKYAS